jgi:hypothetical protein
VAHPIHIIELRPAGLFVAHAGDPVRCGGKLRARLAAATGTDVAVNFIADTDPECIVEVGSVVSVDAIVPVADHREVHAKILFVSAVNALLLINVEVEVVAADALFSSGVVCVEIGIRTFAIYSIAKICHR